MNPLAVLPALLLAVTGALATRVQVLPDVVDVSIILTGSGLGGLVFTLVGALLGFHPDRVGRLAMLGTLLGGVTGAVVLVVGLLIA